MGLLAGFHQQPLRIGGASLADVGDWSSVHFTNAANQGKTFAQQLAAELMAQQDHASWFGALNRHADGRARRAAVQILAQHQHAEGQPRQQRGELWAVRQTRQQLASLGEIVDLTGRRRQVRPLARNHQEVHGLHDFTREGTCDNSQMRWLTLVLVLCLVVAALAAPTAAQTVLQEYDLPRGAGPHDVAPAVDGGVWFTAQAGGYLGWLNPGTGEVQQIPLGRGSAPHGVIVGPDGAAWVTDGGQNAIVRVDAVSHEVRLYPVPGRGANLNTATLDSGGHVWFTGQSGIYGRVTPDSGEVQVWDAPRGSGPYGMTTTPDGRVFYASLAGSHIAEINLDTGVATPVDSPTAGQGARRVWSDSRGAVWVSEWNAGQLGRYEPRTGSWTEWLLPGARPQAYAVYVDEHDAVWLTDWGTNAIVRFDPATGTFEGFAATRPGANMRQLAGRPGEVWAAESAHDRLIVVRHE
jgi:virginiamycin B lyase